MAEKLHFMASLAGGAEVVLIEQDEADPTRANLRVEVAGSVGQWPLTQDSAAATAQTLTKAGVAGKTHHITAIEVSISGAAAANDIFIRLEDGPTTVWKEVIGSGAPRGNRAGIAFNFPLDLTLGNAANLVVDAGGVGVVTTANMAGYTA